MRRKGLLHLSLGMGPRSLENQTEYCTRRQELSAEALCLDRGMCEHLAASRQGGTLPRSYPPGWSVIGGPEEHRPS